MRAMDEPCHDCSPACLRKEIRDGLSSRHPLFVQSLGICSAIALTGYIQTTLVIGIIILLVALLSSAAISLVRKLIIRQARFMVQVTIITSLVILVHLLLKLYWPAMRDALGPYLGLVITNCLVMDSTEQIGMHHRPAETVKRVLGRTTGYLLLLIAVALFREPLGHGSLMGHRIIPEQVRPLVLAGAAPGAFFLLGLFWWIRNAWSIHHQHKTFIPWLMSPPYRIGVVFFAAMLTNNIVLTNFLGLCSFFSLSNQLRTAALMGLSVLVVTLLSSMVNFGIYKLILLPGAPVTEKDLSFMTFLVFILVIAGLVQLLEVILKRYFPATEGSFGPFLALITVNCAIMGVNLFMIEPLLDFRFIQAVAFAAGSGSGWLLVICIMAGIRIKLERSSRIPPSTPGHGHQPPDHRDHGHGIHGILRNDRLLT